MIRFNTLYLAIASMFASPMVPQGGGLADKVKDAEAAEKAAAERAKHLLFYSAKGVKAADGYFEAIRKGDASRMSILKEAQDIEDEDEFAAYAGAYRERGTALANHGTAQERLAGKQVLQMASYLDRVRRSIFGVDRRVPKDVSKIAEFAKVNGVKVTDADGGKLVRCKGMGREAVEKVLEGKGTFPEKMEQLTSTGAGRKNRDGTDNEPRQSRRAATVADVLKAKTIAPDATKFATIIGAPTTGTNKVEGKELQKLGRDTLVAGIKQAPEEILGDLAMGLISRLMASSNDVMQEMGQNFRSHWIAMTQAEKHVGKARTKRQTASATKE